MTPRMLEELKNSEHAEHRALARLGAIRHAVKDALDNGADRLQVFEEFLLAIDPEVRSVTARLLTHSLFAGLDSIKGMKWPSGDVDDGFGEDETEH